MDENFGAVLLIAAIMGLLLILFAGVALWSESSSRGWKEGFHENNQYHRLAIDYMKARIEAREHALAMYRDIATTLCDNTSDCMYCPYELGKQSNKCALWELNEAVKRMDIDEVHVDTKHDGG